MLFVFQVLKLLGVLLDWVELLQAFRTSHEVEGIATILLLFSVSLGHIVEYFQVVLAQS
jgi:hypothetical protein